ncbi:hypothetical protein [Ramlibacter sp.]|uniref:hypothetical protein n=1 Tax=Ramlibacter sp. TaxID=1917967 RepID=UPI003D10605F
MSPGLRISQLILAAHPTPLRFISMTIPHDTARKAVAFRLLGHLDIYEEAIRELAEVGPDATRLGALTLLVDRMRIEAMVLNELAVSWVEFQISHADFIRRLSENTGPAMDLIELEHHIGVILDVEGKRLDLATRDR